VGRLVVEFLGQVDDLDSVEGAFLDADATGFAETEFLGDVNLVGVALVGTIVPKPLLAGDDALLARPVRRTEVCTLVVTPIRLTAVEVDDRDAVVGHLRSHR